MDWRCSSRCLLIQRVFCVTNARISATDTFVGALTVTSPRCTLMPIERRRAERLSCACRSVVIGIKVMVRAVADAPAAPHGASGGRDLPAAALPVDSRQRENPANHGKKSLSRKKYKRHRAGGCADRKGQSGT